MPRQRPLARLPTTSTGAGASTPRDDRLSLATEPDARDTPTVPGYRLLELIDRRPELGSTYRAHDLQRDIAVHVTVAAPFLSRSRRYRERFASQLGLLSSMAHPALAPVIDYGALESELFVVVARPAGVELTRLLEAGPLSPARTLAILEPVADLLDELRARQAFAGDLTPAAIFVAPGDRPVVTRLGLSRASILAAAGQELSRDTLVHVSPEQLRGLSATARSDVYTLGAIAFEALAGWPPFQPPDEEIGAHATAALLALRDESSTIGAGCNLEPRVAALLGRALSETPTVRPASARELIYHLRHGLAAHGTDAARSRGSSRPDEDQGRTLGLPARGRFRRREDGDVRASGGRHRPVTPRAGAAAARRDDVRRPAATMRPHAALRGRRAVVRVAVVAAVMGAGTVFALTRQPEAPAAEPPQTLSAASDVLRISYPETWRRASTDARIPGLPLDHLVAVEQQSGADGRPSSRMLAGMVAQTGATLLPPALERRVSGLIEGEPIRLGEYRAHRYRNLPILGWRANVTLYVVPTDAGTATIACVAPRFVDLQRNRCEAMAATLELRDVRALPLGANAAYGRRLATVLEDLDVARVRDRAQLSYARRHTGQGRRAADLSRDFGDAARRLAERGAEAGTAVIHAQLLSDLKTIRDGYLALARAATRADRSAYDSARRMVTTREASFTETLTRLSELGYRAS